MDGVVGQRRGDAQRRIVVEGDDIVLGRAERQPAHLEHAGVLLRRPDRGGGAVGDGRRGATDADAGDVGEVSRAGSQPVIAAVEIRPVGRRLVHRVRDGVVVILLLRSEHLDVPSAHGSAVLLQGEVHLHGVGEEHVRLAGGPPVPAHDQDVHGIEALEELEDVELPGVEGEAAQANHGEHLLPEAAAGAHAEAGAHPADHAGSEAHGVHHRGGIHRRCGYETGRVMSRGGRSIARSMVDPKAKAIVQKFGLWRSASWGPGSRWGGIAGDDGGCGTHPLAYVVSCAAASRPKPRRDYQSDPDRRSYAVDQGTTLGAHSSSEIPSRCLVAFDTSRPGSSSLFKRGRWRESQVEVVVT